MSPHHCILLILTSGADFDDPEYGVKEEDKDFNKVRFNLCKSSGSSTYPWFNFHRPRMKICFANLPRAVKESMEL